MNRETKKAVVTAAVALGIGVTTMGASVLSARPALAEDVALCVGVNQYPGLRSGSNLGGCVNDAELMSEKLRTYGFHKILLLTDQTATRRRVMDAIASMKNGLGPTDRVVVYFAGHGTISSSGQSVILPGDAQDASEENDIQCDELYDAVKSVGGGYRTILLDSCHSGGMVRGRGALRGWKNRVPRFYVRTKMLNKPSTRAGSGRTTKEWQETDTDGQDNLNTIVKDGGVCYFTAALKDEVANETVISGVKHGIFTYYLAGALNGARPLWETLSAAVSGRVMSETEQEQKPLLAPTPYLKTVVFGGGGDGGGSTPTPSPQPLNLDSVYNLSFPDQDKIKLEMTPRFSPVPVGRGVRFKMTAGADGFLVLIGRDPAGKMAVLFPKNGDIAMARVHAGQVIELPTDVKRVFKANTPGTDGLKAILFTDMQGASAMLKPFRGGRSVQRATAKREWQEDTIDAQSSFYTSELISLIVPADGGDTGLKAPE